MRQITKDQHYVSKFYLKRFADNQGNIQILDLKNHRIAKSLHYSSVCYEKFFYGIESGIFDETSQEFEKMFQGYENIFGDKWESIITNAVNKCLTLEDFDVLSWFLSTQMIRTKKFRNTLHKNFENVEKEVLKKHIKLTDFNNETIVKQIEKHIGEKITKEDLQEAVNLLTNGEFKLNYNNYSYLNFILRNLEGFRNLFFWQQWNIVKSSSKWDFVTTDNPVVEWIPKPEGFWGASFIERKHYVALSPEILIEIKLGSIETDILPYTSVEYHQATDDEVLMYNFLISNYAYSFAYSLNKNEFVEMLEQLKTPKNSIHLYWKNYTY